MQFDIMGAETLLLCRCDTDHAEIITSVIDERDHEYVLGVTKPIEPLKAFLRKAIDANKDLRLARNEWKQAVGLKTFDEAVQAVASDAEYTAYTSELATQAFPGLTLRRHIAKRVVQSEVFFIGIFQGLLLANTCSSRA
jgi:isocitrate lyase